MTPGCSLPDDPAWIARRMRVDAETYNRLVAPLIDEFFTRRNGRISNGKLTGIFNESNEKHSRRVEAGKMGGRPPKPQKANEKTQSNAKAMPKQPEPELELELEDAEAKASDASVDFAKQLWERGVAFLGKHNVADKQARTLIGKWRKAYTDTDIFDAFAACSKQGVIDPVPWITARLDGKGKADGKSSRGEKFLRSFVAGASVAPGMDFGEDSNASQPLLARR
jgi:uncharacterized protein YdaU (DUF1376 family)